MNDFDNIIKYFELKGVYCFESKGNHFKPVITLNSRHEEIILYISEILNLYNIKHRVINRPTFKTVRIEYKKNCLPFCKMIINYTQFRKNEIMKIINYCERKK